MLSREVEPIFIEAARKQGISSDGSDLEGAQLLRETGPAAVARGTKEMLWRSQTMLVTTNGDFYNPSNTALENRGMVQPCLRYSAAKQKGCFSESECMIFTLFSVFPRSTE
jgi:hypothetical protein